MKAEVFVNGVLDGYHYSNKLPDGQLLDLTVDQFYEHELLQPPEPTARVAELPLHGADRYVLLKERVDDAMERRTRGSDA